LHRRRAVAHTSSVVDRRRLTELKSVEPGVNAAEIRPRGTPLSTRLLQSHGLSAKQVARLAEGGWLQRLGRGAYLLPGNPLNRDATLSWLATSVPGLHVAGKTALAWRGMRHNLAFRERLVLWGDKPMTLPTWFTAAFSAMYQATHLFDDGLPAGQGLRS